MNNKAYFEWERKEVLPFVPNRCKKILEVGCGAGKFARILKKRNNAELWGIEPNVEAFLEAKMNLDFVFNINIEETNDLPNNYFDCIIFNDVLEHLADPWSILSNCKNFLIKEESYIIVSVPNFRFWQNFVEIFVKKDFEYKNAGILDKTHLRFFTKKSMKRMFAESGYEVVSMNGINSYKSKYFRFLNFLTLGYISDMQYLQFVSVLRCK